VGLGGEGDVSGRSINLHLYVGIVTYVMSWGDLVVRQYYTSNEWW